MHINNLQYVFLVGGRGLRLGKLTKNVPKPLIDINGKPFLYYQIQYLYKKGVRNFLLLAGYQGKKFKDFLSLIQKDMPRARLELLIEEKPCGTGGAILHAAKSLEDEFILSNGDCFIDFSLRDLMKGNISVLKMLVHSRESENKRYGSLKIDKANNKVTSFSEKNDSDRSNFINAGIYRMNKKEIFNVFPNKQSFSLEKEVFHKLAEKSAIDTSIQNLKFIDIGIESDLNHFRENLDDFVMTNGIIFDRDNTLNYDSGYTYQKDDLIFIKNAIDFVKKCNEKEIPIFIATNQAGIAHGLYTEDQFFEFMNYFEKVIKDKYECFFTKIYFCPHHPESKILRYKKDSIYRKPNPGMLNSIVKDWNIDKDRCLFIGDKTSDKIAAESAEISFEYVNKERGWSKINFNI
ncbi:HAD-IIIA family hydrolase [SAR86 cluster bacterium]|nr:HAD-IIIA family hydrolase [SAR86 cluster bacterium]